MSKIYEALRQAEKTAAIPAAAPVPDPAASVGEAAAPPAVAMQPARPAVPAGAGRPNLGVMTLPENMITGLLRRIETAAGDSKSIAVQITSARRGEGKSTVAVNLAATAALRTGKRVTLVSTGDDTALTALGIPHLTNIAIQYTAGEPIESALTPARSVERLSGTLLRLDAPGAARILESGLLLDLIGRLKAMTDLVIVDAPTVFGSSLTSSLGAALDGTIMVIESERTRWPLVQQACRVVQGEGGSVLGAVLNKRRSHIPAFIYKWL